MLDPFGRGAIVALSALCVAVAFALAPVRGRSSVDDTGLHALPRAGALAAGSVAILPIRRDPFAAPLPSAPSSHAAAGEPLRADAIGTLPANLPSDTIPAIPANAAGTPGIRPRVSAVVTGAQPYAMVETDGVHEIEGVGDRVAGSTIVSIDLDGVRLQNGEHLRIDSADRSR